MQREIEKIRAGIATVACRYGDRLLAVYLFGSLAQGRATSLSDLDLAVLLDPREHSSFSDIRFALYADFSRALRTNDIDMTVLNTLDNLFILEEIVRNGVLLYDARPEVREDFEVRMLHRALDFREQRRHVMGA